MSSEGQRTVDLFLLPTVFIFSSRSKRISKDNKKEDEKVLNITAFAA